MSSPTELRSRLKDVLTWNSAHADLERAVKNVAPEYRGRRTDGLPYSLWQLLEHIRLAQADIAEYCLSAGYASPDWPNDFWPAGDAPPTREAWQESIDGIRRDRQRLVQMLDEVDVEAGLPHAREHTYLREILLVADHSAYHVGQMVLLRRILGIWPP
jgi:hypothetical protein